MDPPNQQHPQTLPKAINNSLNFDGKKSLEEQVKFRNLLATTTKAQLEELSAATALNHNHTTPLTSPFTSPITPLPIFTNNNFHSKDQPPIINKPTNSIQDTQPLSAVDSLNKILKSKLNENSSITGLNPLKEADEETSSSASSDDDINNEQKSQPLMSKNHQQQADDNEPTTKSTTTTASEGNTSFSSTNDESIESSFSKKNTTVSSNE
jgi:hypothetical protein